MILLLVDLLLFGSVTSILQITFNWNPHLTG